jgi:hypothetical protein
MHAFLPISFHVKKFQELHQKAYIVFNLVWRLNVKLLELWASNSLYLSLSNKLRGVLGQYVILNQRVLQDDDLMPQKALSHDPGGGRALGAPGHLISVSRVVLGYVAFVFYANFCGISHIYLGFRRFHKHQNMKIRIS